MYSVGRGGAYQRGSVRAMPMPTRTSLPAAPRPERTSAPVGLIASQPALVSRPEAFTMQGTQRPLMPGGVSTGQLPPGPVYQGGGMMPQPQAPNTGLIGREEALNRGFMGALGILDTGGAGGAMSVNPNYRHIDANRDMALSQVQQGVNAAMPVVNRGIAANDAQAALSGAMGRDAQAQAFADFQNSPGYQYQLEQMERALTRNAAATGGLQGGNVLQALQRNAQGLAAQDFNNYYNRLGTVADRGLQGLGLQAGLYGQGASAATAAGGQGAGVQSSALGANASLGAANTAAQNALARDAANYAMRTGELMATGRTDAGSALANLYNQQGQGLSNIYGQGMANIGNILATGGENQYAADAAQAALLSNVNLGGAGIIGRMPSIPGIQNNPGMLQRIGEGRLVNHQASESGWNAMGSMFSTIGGFGGM